MFVREVTMKRESIGIAQQGTKFWQAGEASALRSGQQSIAATDLNISGGRVLLALLIAFFAMGTLLWSFVRYWLFAP